MKDLNWKIKVSDLLNNPGTTDTIKFENKFLKESLWIQNPGISGEIFLEWLSHDEILAELKNIKFNIQYTCDICWKNYNEEYLIKKNETITFTDNPEIKEEIHDDIFEFNKKNETINIEPFIEIIVKNEEPIIKKCWNCKNHTQIEVWKNQDENLTYTIDFWKMFKS